MTLLLLLLSCTPEPDNLGCDNELLYYKDADTDGYGDALIGEWSCTQRSGWVLDSTDCDDSDPTIHPTREERCDGVDEDCDGEIDEEALDAQPHFFDGDQDGYGDGRVEELACLGAVGWSLDGEDCDDTDPNVYPGAVELCDGRQTNCSGTWAGDDGIATFHPAGGLPPEDWSDTLAGTVQWPAQIAWIDPGTLNMCGGPWYLRMEVQADLVLEGPARDAPAILNGAGQYTPLAVVTPGVVFEGRNLEMRAGYAEEGGGFACTASAQVALEDSAINDNGAEYGGGFHLASSCEVRFDRVSVEGNIATRGGGGGWLTGADDMIFVDVRIHGNSTSGEGGGLAVLGGEGLELNISELSDNSAEEGGNLYLRGARVRVDGLDLTSGRAGEAGGGAFLRESSELWGDDLMVEGNSAGGGGGLAVVESSIDLSVAEFSGNTPDDVSLSTSPNDDRRYTFESPGPLLCDEDGCRQP